MKLDSSHRHSGLDDINAAGIAVFEKLQNFISKKKKEKHLIDKLERGKRHLKITYQSQSSIGNVIASHNSTFSLSTLKEEPRKMKVLREYSTTSTHQSTTSSSTWSIRWDIYNRKRAKAFCFVENRRETIGFRLKDCIQKKLPVWYYAGQWEYFGKKGMSNHIDVFCSKQKFSLKDAQKYIVCPHPSLFEKSLFGLTNFKSITMYWLIGIQCTILGFRTSNIICCDRIFS